MPPGPPREAPNAIPIKLIRNHLQKIAPIILRARIALPITTPPIENAAITIHGNRITSITPWSATKPPPRAQTLDLGETLILPGLVNAHCHLDYTAMAGLLPPPRHFTDWIQNMMASKSGWTYSDFAESWLQGAQQLLRTGTTTVGDIEMAPELLPDVWSATPLRVFSFLEMTGVKSKRPPREIIREALDKISSLPSGSRRVGLSPHAPYSTTPALLRLAAHAARRHHLRLAIHVAESAEEAEMYNHATGKMHTWLTRNGRDMTDCGQRSPIQHLEHQGILGRNLIAIHVNYLALGDAPLLAKRRVTVCHCPRSHAYFKHQPFPLAQLATAGINICLGTDSLASLHGTRKQTLELNMFDEMRELADNQPTLKPETILQMATVNSAIALGLKGRVGELAPKTYADLIALPYTGKPAEAPAAALNHRGALTATLLDGKWTLPPASAN